MRTGITSGIFNFHRSVVRSFIKKFIDLLLYGNFWIAACAVAMGLQTQLILSGSIQWDPTIGFIGAATFLLYAIHKAVGIRKMEDFTDQGRFAVISQYRSHIITYGVLGFIASIYYFTQLSPSQKFLVTIPALLSLGYVVPLPRIRLRFRDIHYIKIFLIAFVWSWVTVFIPSPISSFSELGSLFPMFLERAVFIFAITLPFDIRDRQIDEAAGLQTIPHKLGIGGTRVLITIALLVALALAFWCYHLEIYSPDIVMALAISYVITFFLGLYSNRINHDYYFSGLIDGLMIIQFIIVCMLVD